MELKIKEPVVTDDRDKGGQEISVTSPDPLDKNTGYVVEVTIPDYVKNHTDAIARGDTKLDTPSPNVKVYHNIDLKCLSCNVEFKSTFAEVQRILMCPNGCGAEVEIPPQYRGMP